MCQGKPSGEAQNLHEKICHVTHGIPCKTAHAVGNLFNLILGRQPKNDSCSGPGQHDNCDCSHEKS